MTSKKENIASWFSEHLKPHDSVEVKVHVLDADNSKLEDFISHVIPSCYITKNTLDRRIKETGLSASEILKNKIPDPGNVMAGDFGEILTLYYLGNDRTEDVKKVKKWRYKQDRKKPAPHTDVIILSREKTDNASVNDFVICAESKVKSTNSKSEPIKNSIIGYESDKTGRLARTLVWLKEKAIENEKSSTIDFIRRFTDDLLDTSFNKYYRAVAIIDREYLDEELSAPLGLPHQSDEFEVIVIGINDLKNLYETCFSKALIEVENE